jgi:outer membrane protein assembly factor BamA
MYLNKKRCFTFLAFLLLVTTSWAQQQQQQDSLRDVSSVPINKLPFAIAKEKQIGADELAAKKEGVTVAGIPDVSSDPINGQGIGAEGSVFFNGKRSDPFFAYTPYRAELKIAAFITNKAQKSFSLGVDIPYVANTKWRLRGEAAYSVDPNQLYFGVTEKSLAPLSYTSSSNQFVNNASFKEYENSLKGKNAFYNTYTKTEAVLNISGERSFYEGRIRVLVGYEIAGINIKTPLNDSSFVSQDAQAGHIKGYGQNRISLLQTGIVYDTRDLETDPSNGIFAEITNELSTTALGSQYNFNKTFVHVNGYYKLLPKTFKKVILCGSFGMGATSGAAPFFEYADEWSSEGDIDGMGGSKTLRGYKQARFAAAVMQYTNFELRARFMKLIILKQHLVFSAVPFFDEGGVWDNLSRINHLENLRYSEGLGLRIVWNANSVLRFDYAVSNEDHQFFFQLGHTF